MNCAAKGHNQEKSGGSHIATHCLLWCRVSVFYTVCEQIA